MAVSAFKTYAQDHGGRVILLFLLFLLAVYEFITAGFSAFAIICLIPLLLLVVIAGFRYKMLTFWALILVNYFIQWKNFPYTGLPMSLHNELLEIILLVLAIIDVKESRFERTINIMLYALIIWSGFCTLEVLNDTCNLGINIGRWYTGARLLGFSLIYIFLVFSIYINNTKNLTNYLIFWGLLAFFAALWTWKQKNIGFTDAEDSWLHNVGYRTHILNGGTLIRYFSVYNDAANFGIGIASTAIAFIIFGLTARIKRFKLYFLIVGFTCSWAFFQSGTRTAIACFLAGFMVYILLSKSIKIAIPFTVLFSLFVFMLVFTNIGNSNQQIRRMRSAFNKEDASANARKINQEAMKKYLRDAPWGLGIGMSSENIPANNKFAKLSTIPPDSEYVFIWVHTGIIGISTFLITTIIMFLGACWIVLFKIKSPSLRGIGAGFCCAFVSQQLGGYGNQVLLGYPNGLVFYGGLTIVYILPYLEKEWTEYENKQLAIQEEKKRLKLEKKKASRV